MKSSSPRVVVAGLTAAFVVAALPCAAAEGSQIVRYEADDTDFANPERGFSRADASAEAARRADMSLVHVYFRLEAFRSRPLPDSFLRQVQERFDEARAGGVKLIPRFTYNFPAGLPLAPGDEDAPLGVALGHISQLTPILRDNSDVIAFAEAGFVGAWGEWHHSTSGIDTTAAKAAILHAVLRALPEDRAVAVRYQRDKIAIFGRTEPLSASEAFTGAPVARVGHHNDCFLASRNDWDTYRVEEGRPLEAQKAYLAAENRYVPQGGETCNAAEDAQPFIPCANALAELKTLRWTQLNSDYHPEVLALWRKQGCHGEIAKRLGYRFRLISASLPRTGARGDPVGGTVTVANDGFAAPYNPRGFELILRHAGTGREHVLALEGDPRRWSAGETRSLALDARLPAALPTGDYRLFLNLPDPSPRLRGRPEYSIRLANRGVWEAATGYNDLQATLRVK